MTENDLDIETREYSNFFKHLSLRNALLIGAGAIAVIYLFFNQNKPAKDTSPMKRLVRARLMKDYNVTNLRTIFKDQKLSYSQAQFMAFAKKFKPEYTKLVDQKLQARKTLPLTKRSEALALGRQIWAELRVSLLNAFKAFLEQQGS